MLTNKQYWVMKFFKSWTYIILFRHMKSFLDSLPNKNYRKNILSLNSTKKYVKIRISKLGSSIIRNDIFYTYFIREDIQKFAELLTFIKLQKIKILPYSIYCQSNSPKSSFIDSYWKIHWMKKVLTNLQLWRKLGLH